MVNVGIITIEPGQSDPAWMFIKLLSLFKIAKNIGEPRIATMRCDLKKR